MIINEHQLVHAGDAGNGYHGNCKHCGIPLVTDLGYCSWDGVKCIDRELSSIVNLNELPSKLRVEILQYANFCGYKWDVNRKIFVKATFSDKVDEKTIEQIKDKLNGILYNN